MYEFVTTITTTDEVVLYQLVSHAEALRLLDNMHIGRLRQVGHTLIVETDNGLFRRFFDCIVEA